MKRYLLIPALVGLSALFWATPQAGAQTWTKTGNPGNTPATAQITTGVGGLTTITGTLSSTTSGSERNVVNVSNPDLFAITITGTVRFSATTVGQPTTLFDPRLFLFNSAGLGVYYNDDSSAFTHGATIAPTTTLSAGLYYIGIGTYGAIPRNAVPIPADPTTSPPTPAKPTTAANDIFPDPFDITTTGFTGLFGPTGPGGALPLLSWSLSGADVETGSYTIALTGASFAAAPEPSQMVGLAIGAAGLLIGTFRARRKRSVA